MHYIPIKTKIMQPPKDDLFALLDEYLVDVQEGDIILVTSKIVAIGEGRCVPMQGTNKRLLVEKEAEYIFDPDEHVHPLTIINHALISSAGIDESNGSGYYVLLPEDPFQSAETIHTYLKNKFHLRDIGVIVTDSHSLPFRYGAMSISIGYWGFQPIEDHIGRPDLFGRKMQYSKTNLVDAISAGSALVSGECDECQPIVIAREIPNLVFTEEDVRNTLLIPPQEDMYRSLFANFKKQEK